MGDQSNPQPQHQPVSLAKVESAVNAVRAVIAKYPVLAALAATAIGYYGPILKPYVVALGRLVGLTCQ